MVALKASLASLFTAAAGAVVAHVLVRAESRALFRAELHAKRDVLRVGGHLVELHAIDEELVAGSQVLPLGS